MGLAKASLEANVRYMANSLGPEGHPGERAFRPARSRPWRPPVSAASADAGPRHETAPLRRTITAEEVGNVAAFLCSDLASGVTGEITFVDSGYSILGMPESESGRRVRP